MAAVVTPVSPSEGGILARNDFIVVDITTAGDQAHAVYVEFLQAGLVEVAFTSWDTARATAYTVFRHEISGGYRYRILRNGGWVSGMGAPSISVTTPPVNPPSIISGSNCELWCEARSATDDGGDPTSSLISIEDLSSGGVDLTEDGSSTRPVGTTPIQGSANFNRTCTSAMRVAADSGNYSMILRGKQLGTRVYGTIGDPCYTWFYCYPNGRMYLIRFRDSITLQYAYTSTTTEARRTCGVSFRYNNGVNSLATFYHDGVAVGTSAGNGNKQPINLAANEGPTQGLYTSSGFVDGQAALQIVGEISAADHLSIHNYLASAMP